MIFSGVASCITSPNAIFCARYVTDKELNLKNKKAKKFSYSETIED